MERIFKLQNLNCANCASVIEAKLNQLESVSAATSRLAPSNCALPLVLKIQICYEIKSKRCAMLRKMV